MKLSANSKCLMILLGFCLFYLGGIQAQKFKYSIPGFELDSLKESFIVGGGSSTVLKRGQGEIIWNNSLTSYWLALHQVNENSPVVDRFRSTQFTSDIFGFYGVSESGRWDVGIHIKYVRTRVDNAASSSMFKVFEGGGNIEELINAQEDPNALLLDQSFGDISSVGIRFRAAPLPLDPKFVINGGFSVKTVTGEEKAKQLGADRNAADIGLTYYKGLTNQTFYFLGASAQAFFPTKVIRDEYLFNTSLNFFLIHRALNNKLTIYPGLGYNLAFKPSKFASEPHSLIKTTEFLFAFGGIQYAPTTRYNFFLTGGVPLIVNVVNPQLQIVRESYSNIGIGLRVGL